MALAADEDQSSYIDYETFLSPDFNAYDFANKLVLTTNDPNDAPLDLSTPLSRVLFDIQEIDSHIDMLTARSAVPLLTHTQDQTLVSKRTVAELEPQIQSLNESYKQLEKQVIQKHAEAEAVRRTALRLWETQRLGRAVGRCLQLGRQLEVQYAELENKDHRALVRCAHTILSLRDVLEHRGPGNEAQGVERVVAVRRLQEAVVVPTEKTVRETAERVVREFSVSNAAALTFVQAEDVKARMASALTCLYLLSPTAGVGETWSPRLLQQAVETYLRAALQSSVTSLARSFSSMPAIERTLAEVSARCQNIAALELVLATTKAPAHPLGHRLSDHDTLLSPVLTKLESGSLPSYFWRSLAGSLSSRVQDVVLRGGVAARTLRTNKSTIGDAIQECVVRGVQPPAVLTSSSSRKATPDHGWEREIAVMVGSVTGHFR